MSIAVTNLLGTSSTSSATSFTTASVSPAAAQLLLLSTINAKSGGANTPTITGLGLTWQLLNTAAFNGDRQVSVFGAFTGAAAPTPGTILIDFGANTQVGCGWILDSLSSAWQALQATSFNVTGTSVTKAYTTFGDAVNNLAYAAVGNEHGVLTPRASWTNTTNISCASGRPMWMGTEYFIGSDTAASASRVSSATWGIVGLEVALRTVT